MPWYALAYVVLFVGMAVYSTYDDFRVRPAWYLVVDALVSIVWLYFVFAFYRQVAPPPGTVVLWLFLFGVVWTIADVRLNVLDVIRDRPLGHDRDLSPGVNLWVDRIVEAFGLLVGVLIGGPAVVAGAIVAMRAW